MAFFSRQSTTDRYAVLLNIGSGSVLGAIVHSKAGEPRPTIVWSKREFIPLRGSASPKSNHKAIATALMEIMLQLDQVGRQALHAYNAHASIKHIHCTITAPWSYTISKTVSYSKDEPFTITQDLIDELTKAAEDKIISELQEDDRARSIGLSVIDRATVGILCNGYNVKQPIDQAATEIQLAQVTVVTHEQIAASISESIQRVFTGADATLTSHMRLLFETSARALVGHTDYCLVDITAEATEIGIVRDGVLRFCTHAPSGSMDIAREIANAANIPLSEAYLHLQSNTLDTLLEKASKIVRTNIEQIFIDYQAAIESLLHETGDQLSIPQHICLHVEQMSEPLFAKPVRQAAATILHTAPRIHSLIGLLQEQGRLTADVTDNGLSIIAQFFHTPRHL